MELMITVGGALITLLLAIIAYFLKQLHSDFKELRMTLQNTTQTTAVMQERQLNFDKRLYRIESKLE